MPSPLATSHLHLGLPHTCLARVHYFPAPRSHCFVPSPRVELPHEGQLGQGLLGGHWHLPHVDCDAGFMLKRPERRGHIRDRLPLVGGRNIPGSRCPAQRSNTHVFRIPDLDPWHHQLGISSGPGVTDSLLPHPLYGPPTDLHPTSPHGTPEKLATVSTCQPPCACTPLL